MPVRTSLPFISTILNTAPSRAVPSTSSTLESSTAPLVKLFFAVTEIGSACPFSIVKGIGFLFKS